MFKTLHYYKVRRYGSFDCIKCGRELDMGTINCPYCDHKQFDFSGDKITWNTIELNDPLAIDGVGDPDWMKGRGNLGEPRTTDWQVALEYIRYRDGDRKIFDPTWQDK